MWFKGFEKMVRFINKDAGITALPNSFIDKYMPVSEPEYVLVYIFALRHALEDIEWTESEIANKLGISPESVKKAFEYWKRLGLISVDSNNIVFETMPDDGNVNKIDLKNRISKEITDKKEADDIISQPPKYNSTDVFKNISADRSLKEMLDIAQTILGKNLTHNEAVTLYSFYDWLGFKTEVVLLLLEYCVSQGKKSLKYIERVAISWHEMNLTTVESVDDYINTQKQRKNYVYNVCRVLGIENRRLTPTEQKFIHDWHDNCNVTPEMIAYAYDACVAQTGKLAMAYIDKIVKRWHESGITSVEQIIEDKQSFASQHQHQYTKQPGNNFNLKVNNSENYDFDKMRRQAAQNLKEYLPKK